MRKTCGAFCLWALASAWPAAPYAAEFQESDVLPEIGYTVFTRDAVGFVSRPNRQIGVVFWFSYERQERRLAEIDARQFQARFPGSALKEDPRRSGPGEEEAWSGRTGNGTEYRSKVKYCGEGVENDQRALVVGGRLIRILGRDKCTSVSAVEVLGDQLWLGTAYSGEGGSSEAEGIIVESSGDGRALARIPLKGWVNQLRADPFSDEVWAVTEYGIYQLNRKFHVISAGLYYHDFDPSSGEPRLSFSSAATEGNPLSVISRMLPAGQRKGFYEAARAIPKADLDQFKLYDFFMCCFYKGRRYPESFRPLLPFFVGASAQSSGILWRQAACGFGTPDVAEYCESVRRFYTR